VSVGQQLSQPVCASLTHSAGGGRSSSLRAGGGVNSAHTEHAVAPHVAEYELPRQPVQTAWPGEGVWEPGAHSSHSAVAPPGEYDPASHLTQAPSDRP
jgi:hypothetical protein